MNASAPQYDPYPFEEFAPTLSQCFVIVIVGYLMSRLEILSASDVKGVVGFASYFAMPGIICVSLADADFSDFRWELLFGIFLGKCLTFVAVSAFMIFLDGNMGVAGTVALFLAQSNDLPVGNPLMSSLYKDHRPYMMKYLFLIPAMTIIFFLPFSNLMVRLHRSMRTTYDQDRPGYPSYKQSLLKYLQDKEHLNEMYGLVKNPVVIATILGLVLNAIFRKQVPGILHKPIDVAAKTIPGIALAMLGFSFVRKERYLLTSAVIPAAVLLVLKMVVTPILLHTIVRMLTEESRSSKLLSDFSLLYGIISPATAVFLMGQEFRKSLAVMSVALILTSFGCFPVSYVVARITIAPVHELNSYIPLLKNILFWTACISIFCDVVCGISLFWRNLWPQVPPCYFLYLVFTQFITCAGVLISSLSRDEPWSSYCHMALYYGGELSGYLWAGTLAVVLVFRKRFSLLTEGCSYILCFTVFSLSGLIITVMCILMSYGDVQSVYVVARPRSKFEYLQLIITTTLLFISLIVIFGCLVYHFKRKNLQSESTKLCGYDNSVFYIQGQEEVSKDFYKRQEYVTSPLKLEKGLGESEEAKVYYQEILKDGGEVRDELISSEMRDWTFRLSSLLTLQGLIMFVRVITCVFKLNNSKALEIMIPMEFLQCTLFIGQGIFILLTLGVDVRTTVLCLRKWWRKMRYGKDEMSMKPTEFQEKGEVVQFCNQFYNFYYDRSFADIAKERRWKDEIYKDSFWGHQLVDWMIGEGLCLDDTDAESKGQKLLAGGVLRHVEERHHFYDAPYLYCFKRKEKPASDSSA